jgi:hypothetical protein
MLMSWSPVLPEDGAVDHDHHVGHDDDQSDDVAPALNSNPRGSVAGQTVASTLLTCPRMQYRRLKRAMTLPASHLAR